MTEQEIRDIINDELKNILKIDRYVWDKNLQILDARNIQLGQSNGTKIGTAITQKLGFYGATPVDRPETISDPSGGATIDAQARSAIGALIDRLQELGLLK